MKVCFKCNRVLPLCEYYAHPQMGDGHLNKCKDCTRKDSENRRAIKEKDPVWREAEYERHRLKQEKRRIEGKAIPSGNEAECKEQWNTRNPQKKRAQVIVARAIKSGFLIKKPCRICGNPDSEGHHEDYSKPLDVDWLCPKHHAERNREIRKVLRALEYQKLQLEKAL